MKKRIPGNDCAHPSGNRGGRAEATDRQGESYHAEAAGSDADLRQHAARLWPSIEDAASEADRRWFEAHPERTYHIRLARRGEQGLTAPAAMVVIKVCDTLRIRLPWPTPPLSSPEARREFERLLSAIDRSDENIRAAGAPSVQQVLGWLKAGAECVEVPR